MARADSLTEHEQLLKTANARLYPSLTDPNFLVLDSRRRIFKKWIDALPQKPLQILDVEKGDVRALTGRAKQEGYPVFSPDGSRIAYWFPRDGQSKNVTDIYVAAAAGGESTNLTRGIDRNIQRAIHL